MVNVLMKRSQRVVNIRAGSYVAAGPATWHFLTMVISSFVKELVFTLVTDYMPVTISWLITGSWLVTGSWTVTGYMINN